VRRTGCRADDPALWLFGALPASSEQYKKIHF
jgi:hypothetical protein